MTPAIRSASQAAAVTPAQLAEEIRAKHGEVRSRTLQGCRELGEMLLKAKAALGHGGFLSWVEANCKISSQSARDYMNIARNWGVLEAAAANSQRAVDFSLREALGEIAKAEEAQAGVASRKAAPATPPAEARLLRDFDRSIIKRFGSLDMLPQDSGLGLEGATYEEICDLPFERFLAFTRERLAHYAEVGMQVR